MNDIEAIKQRLREVLTDHEILLKIAGTPGAAIAVVHEGELIYQTNIGVRDIENNLPVTDETIFPCASLTKAVLSAGVGICVDESKANLTWETRVKDVLPEFRTRDEILHHNMTVTDCLSHRSGMQPADFWIDTNSRLEFSSEKQMDVINDLHAVHPFRAEYDYNNFGYEVAGHILSKVAGQRWDHFLKERIFDPLGMTRTSTNAVTGDNVAKGYWALDDASAFEVPPNQFSGETLLGPAGGMHSSIKDLIKLYTSFLDTAKHQYDTGLTSTPGSPLKQIPALWSAKINMRPGSLLEQSYALGWGRVQTPGPLGQLRPQPLQDVAKGHPSELILYHQGSMPGALAAVNLIPRTRTAIVVLTNSLSLLCDPANFIGQSLLEAYMGIKSRNDYMALAKQNAKDSLKWYPDVVAELEAARIKNTTSRSLEEYVGKYENESGTLIISVSISGEDNDRKLMVAFRDDGGFELKHYHYDTFSWLQPRDELIKKCSWPNYASFYLLAFKAEVMGGKIESLMWRNAEDTKEPARLTKTMQ